MVSVMKETSTVKLDQHELQCFMWRNQTILQYVQLARSIILEKPDLFDRPNTRELNREQLRDLCNRQLIYFSKEILKRFPKGQFVLDFKCFSAIATVLYQFDQSLSIKHSINYQLFLKNLVNLGNLPVHQDILWSCIRQEQWGAFMMTEVGHGSNVQGVRTTATYDQNTQEFVINTPDDLAAKFWIGNLAKTATIGVVIAQLIVGNKNCGVHLFIAKLRDKETHTPCPGIIIGDCGPKAGMHGIDNGICWFQNYRIPRENLLNRVSNVSPDGKFTSIVASRSKRFGMQMSGLSSGRVGLSVSGATIMNDAVVAAIRYGSVRQQFNTQDKTRQSFLNEYALHQHRLFTILAKSVVYKVLTLWLADKWSTITTQMLSDAKNIQTAQTHALSAVIKPLVTWECMKSLQECRESCGGHGFSQFARFGSWRQEFDVNVTWQGDNNILLQQCTKWMLSSYSKGRMGKFSSLKQLEIFDEGKWDRAKVGFSGPLKWKVQTLLQQTVAAIGKDGIEAWNDLQPICIKKLGLAMGEYHASVIMKQQIAKLTNLDNKKVLNLLLDIFCVSKILEDVGTFRHDDYISSEQALELKYTLRTLNAQLGKDVIQFVDGSCSPDFFIASSLGYKDRENLYKRYLNDVRGAKKFHKRSEIWRQFFPRPLKPKL